MGKKLPRTACRLCGLTNVAFYPSTGVLVRHLRGDGEPTGPDGYWCSWPDMQRNGEAEQGTDNATPTYSGGAFFGGESDGGPTGPLADWWRTLAEYDLARVLPKAREYSAYDMVLIGKATADLVGFAPVYRGPYEEDIEEGVYAEIGCWFYILGKVGRAIGAIKEGRLPSEDTAMDTRIYATMISRIKQCGEWPGDA